MTTFQVGDRITRENCWDIPPGTTVDTGSYGVALRTRFGWLLPNRGEWGPIQGEILNRNIASLPAFVRPETYRQYVNRLISIAVGQGIANGISMSGVIRLLADLHVERTDYVPGDWVHINDHEHRLPVGTVGQQGDPSMGNYRVCRWSGTEWVRIVGSTTGGYGMQIIDPTTGWVDESDLPAGTEEDALRISQLQDQMIALGAAAKSRNSWCGQYERSLELMTINANKAPAGTPAVRPAGSPLAEGDRVRMVNRYTINGRRSGEDYDNYAVIGDVGRITNVERNGIIAVAWDRSVGSYGNRRIDASCVEREVPIPVDTPAVRPIQRGDRVRMISNEYRYGGQANPRWLERFARPGEEGVVRTTGGTTGGVAYIDVLWDRTSGEGGVSINLDCVELVVEQETVADEPALAGSDFTVGMRVRRREGQVLRFNGVATGTSGTIYDTQTPAGGEGEVTTLYDTDLAVLWDDFTYTGSRRALMYDADCLYPVSEAQAETVEPLAVGDQVMLIPGARLTCSDEGNAMYEEQQGAPNNVGTIVNVMNAQVEVRWHHSNRDHWYDMACFQRAEFVVGAVVQKHPDRNLELSDGQNMNHREAQNPDGARVERLESGGIVRIRWINGGTHGGYRPEGLRIMSMPVPTDNDPQPRARVDGVLAA